MELGRGRETSEGQETMALTDDSLLRGHALRGLSKYFDYKNVNFLYSRQMSVLVLFLSSHGVFSKYLLCLSHLLFKK